MSISKNAAPMTIDVLANDTDVDAGDTKAVIAVNTAGLQGTVAVAADGKSVVYTVGGSFLVLASTETATESFTYTMVDGTGVQSTATVTVHVTVVVTPAG